VLIEMLNYKELRPCTYFRNWQTFLRYQSPLGLICFLIVCLYS